MPRGKPRPKAKKHHRDRNALLPAHAQAIRLLGIVQTSTGVSRLLAGLTILKHAFNPLDEKLCGRWMGNSLFPVLMQQDLLSARPALRTLFGHPLAEEDVGLKLLLCLIASSITTQPPANIRLQVTRNRTAQGRVVNASSCI